MNPCAHLAIASFSCSFDFVYNCLAASLTLLSRACICMVSLPFRRGMQHVGVETQPGTGDFVKFVGFSWLDYVIKWPRSGQLF